MSDDLTRAIAEALGCEWAKAPGYEYCAEHGFSEKGDAWPCPETRKTVAALAPLLDEHAAEVLEDAADKFQWGAWIDVLSGGLVQRRTDGEAVVRWLRERSRALRGEA